MTTPRTLKGRMLGWIVAVVMLTILGFGATVYWLLADQGADEDEPPGSPAAVAELHNLRRRMLEAVAVALPGALAVAVVGGAFIARRSLKPIDAVTARARQLGAEELDRRVPIGDDAPAELRRLAETFNTMLARLEQSVRGISRFNADASHELRTPLTTMRGNLELTLRHPRSPEELRAALETALVETDRLAQLVDTLLTLARSDAGELPLEVHDVELRGLVEKVVSPFETLAGERRIAIEVVAEKAAHASVDGAWLGRAVANLVDNACKFTPDGGRVRVTLRPRGDRAEIVVSDTGPGVPSDERGRVFERFHRGRRGLAAQGFGLGLAIASEITQRLGGTLTVGDAEEGGAAFTLSLPRTA
jgi:heavy metal sensor kinase